MQLRLYVVLGLTAVASALASGQRVVLVTGANKGIGKEIARTLGFLPDHFVVLGCRDEALGNAAVAELRAAGCDCAFTRLDLLDVASIASTRDFIQDTFGRLDGLVNNAAICFNDPTLYGTVPHTPFQQQADITIRTNYHGTVAVTEAMLPLLRKSEASPRVVNVASAAGRLRGSQEIQDAFTAHDLDLPALTQLMEDFVRDVEAGVHAERGWPNTCYGVSKMGLIAYTRVLAQAEPGLMVNSVDPGFCATDQVGCCCGCCCCHACMDRSSVRPLRRIPTAFSFLFVALLLVTDALSPPPSIPCRGECHCTQNQHQGYISAAQGAETPALLAHAPFGSTGDDKVSGLHFYERQEINWSYLTNDAMAVNGVRI